MKVISYIRELCRKGESTSMENYRENYRENYEENYEENYGEKDK